MLQKKQGNIPLENATIYKKDWLKGYKEIEIPENKALMQEYNAIEQTSKASKFSKLSEVYDIIGHLPKEQQISETVNHSLISNLKNFFKKDVSIEIPEVKNKYYTEHIISDDIIPNGYKIYRFKL